MRLRLSILTILVLIPFTARADGFDWALLKGNWAESTKNQYGCRPDNVHHQFMLRDGNATLQFKLDRRWKIGTGEEVTEYAATIVSAAPNVLTIKYGPEMKGIPDDMREWELRFIGPGTYRWRSTAWGPNDFNNVIGVRCSQ